jgi:hypothetical protein
MGQPCSRLAVLKFKPTVSAAWHPSCQSKWIELAPAHTSIQLLGEFDVQEITQSFPLEKTGEEVTMAMYISPVVVVRD